MPEVSTPPGLPEVSPEEDMDAAKQTLKTIQDQKEELRQNGELIKQLVQALDAKSVMAAEKVMLPKEKMEPTQKTMEKCNVYDGKGAVADTIVKLPSYQNIIQNQKEKPNRTGEATTKAAERICEFDSADNEVIEWDVVDNEVVDCDAGEEFNDLCCSPCAEEEWLPSQCCNDDGRNCRTSKQLLSGFPPGCQDSQPDLFDAIYMKNLDVVMVEAY